MRSIDSIKQFPLSILFAVVAAMAALGMGCMQEEQPVDESLEVAALATPVDMPTGTMCNYTAECPFNAYCNPTDHKCYAAIGTQCLTNFDCATLGPTSYCHARRCHQGSLGCTTNMNCTSGTFCHIGICHADMCLTNTDCPSGVTCHTPWQTCLIP